MTQVFKDWTENDPLNIPCNHPHLLEALQEARGRLSIVQHLIESNGWDSAYSGLYKAVCDGYTATQEACDRVSDSPDDDTPGALIVRPYPSEPLVISVVEGEFIL